MGWASGSQLMRELIDHYVDYGGNVVASARIGFWMNMIKAFEDLDCDTLDECLGVNRWYDAAYLTILKNGADDESLNEQIAKCCEKSPYTSLNLCQTIYNKVYNGR